MICLLKIFVLAIKGIMKNKLRSFLTMLGVIIGVTSVILLMNIIEGFKQDLMNSYENMGVSTIEVNTYFDNDSFSVSELEKFTSSNPNTISGYSPAIDIFEQEVKYNQHHFETSVKGVGVDYGSIKRLALSEGSFLNYVDIEYNRSVCVIGSYVSNQLFGDSSPVGNQITINGKTYSVVGVIEEQAGSERGSTDDIVYIPYTSAQIISQSDKINNVLFLASNKESITVAMEVIDSFLFSKIGDAEKYSVYCLNEVISNMNDMMSKISLLLICVALISLIVGGIGIMNIMFVSVVERTKEIGIRTAIGAPPKSILQQFLIEAITTSSIGGAIGIIFGCLISYIAANIIDIPFVLSINAVIISVVVSVTIGGVFGYLPARRAALMNPVFALTSD